MFDEQPNTITDGRALCGSCPKRRLLWEPRRLVVLATAIVRANDWRGFAVVIQRLGRLLQRIVLDRVLLPRTNRPTNPTTCS